ncbi:putative disease resistance protein RGA3 [Quercus robur]|uniref:putative disease resistance protein RGA3 n=1 Tax=Quercus robur TaxID=38942 RepID=UPI00216301C5|nr:putative disease resistance protein RGA3 [Quercus robur]
MDRLQDQLRKKIDQKKYLLVLDDVWNEDFHKWDNLKNLLMGGAKGSRIVITTRIKLVADITSPFSIYTLTGLSENQSWFLFEQIAFRKGQETHNLRLVEIGREIVRKCQGVPLTIKSTGRVLRFKENELEWSYVKDNILESVTQQESGIFPTIKLSYDYLPSNLKGCFAFCSLFPKDYEIDKMTLIQLWISQGFIQSSNKQLEDVADAYVKDLLWRSFFEEVSDEVGYLKYYKMHDLIHDLAQSIAGAECTLVNLDKKNIDGKTRHISCQFSIDSSFIKTLRLGKANMVRTLLLTHDNYASGAMDMSTLNKLIENFTSLRALDLHGLKITKVPNSIEKLIHLKYFDLSFNYIENLPNSITTLLNLQTLKLQQCLELKQLPGNIAKLVNLKHLDNSGCFGLSYMPHSVGQMTGLQTLPLFIVSKDPHSIFKQVGGLGELNQLNNLRGTLHIICLEQLEDTNSECKAANLRGKQHLEKLILRWYQEGNINNDNEKSLEELQPHQNLKYLELYGYKGVKFSSWLSSLTNLVDLDLQFCARCKHLPSLSQLPSLKRLYMRYMDDLEYISERDISDSSTPFFPLLKSLEIHYCYNLKGWWRSTSTLNHQQNQLLPSFPRLSFLKIEHCSNLASMPLFPFLEEELCLIHSSSKPLQQTMAIASLPSSSFTPFPLSKLKSMSLYNIEDEVSLPPNLNSLKSLDIQWCPRLISLSGVMRYLTSLEKLSIKWCDEFNPLSDVDADGMEWRHLNCLRSLNFENLQKLEYLPAGLQNVTTLQSLFISSCPNLKSFPEWISELTSLDKLGIFRCGPNLRSLPHGISCLTSLRWLTISGLPNFTTFPESISNLTSLQELELSHSLLLRSLPDGINCLRSLQKLRIQGFPNLTTFPEISNLTSLEELVISKCPNLTSLPDRISCLRFLP